MTDELKGVTAMLASPTYGPVEPSCQKALRVAMMTASNHGMKWAGDISPDHLEFSTARNQCAQTLYDFPEAATGIIWVDSDIVLEPDSILKLVGGATRSGHDFVSGVYHKKGEPYEPVLYWYEPELDAYYPVTAYEPGFVSPIGACGFGFVWTTHRVVQAIHDNKAHWNDDERWFPDTRHHPKKWRSWDGRPPYGEDFNFCDKARMAGIQLYLDSGCMTGHSGQPLVYDRDMYLKWLAQNGGQWKPPDKDAWRG